MSAAQEAGLLQPDEVATDVEALTAVNPYLAKQGIPELLTGKSIRRSEIRPPVVAARGKEGPSMYG